MFKTLLDMKRGFVLFSDFSSLMGVAVMPEQFLKAVKAVRLRVSGVRLVLSVFELLIGDGIGDNDDKNDERSMECGVWIIIIAENWQKKIIYQVHLPLFGSSNNQLGRYKSDLGVGQSCEHSLRNTKSAPMLI